MAKLFELQQARATVTESIRALMDRYDGKEMAAEDKTALTAMETEFDGINAKITAEQKQLDRERIAGEKPAAELAKGEPKAVEQMQAFRAFIREGSGQSAQIYAALQQANPTQAGFLVAPEEFRFELIREIADETFMRREANVLPALNGAISLGYPTRTDAMTGGAWGTEISTAPDATSAKYGKREFKPRPHTVLDKISETLIRNLPNADAYVRNEFAEYFGGATEQAYMTGDGANQPLGLFVASDDGIPTTRDITGNNTATEMKFDALMDAKYSLKAQYQPNAKWLMHRDGVKQLAKLKNSDGQYIWQPSVVMGTPDMLLAKPVLMSEYAPNTFTTGQYVALYGDLKNYWIADSLMFQIKVLLELYATTNQIGYIGRLETDGAPVRPNAFARVKLG